MSSTVQCFPIMSSFKQETSDLAALLQSHSAALQQSSADASKSSSQSLATPLNSASLFEKLLAAQAMDPLSYLAALLPGLSQAGMPFQNSAIAAAMPGTANGLPLMYTDKNFVGKNGSKRRNRTTFTHDQAASLEKEYAIDQYMPRSRRALVAETLNLSESQVKTWFQNRRAKDKRTDKINGLHNSHLLAHSSSSGGKGMDPESPSSSSASSLAQIQKQLTPTFDTNFLMPPPLGMRPTPSPSSSAASSSHSPLSPLSPNILNGPINFLQHHSPTSTTSSNNINSAAALTAFYMQALQLHSSMSPTSTASFSS